MKIIVSYCGKYEAKVDDDDYEKLKGHTWSYHKPSSEGSSGYLTTKPSDRPHKVRMHELIIGKEPGKVVDHIDGDGLNNQKHNLRFATSTQNAWNRKPPNGRKYKGTRYEKNRRCWYAEIYAHGVKYHCGSFETEEDAARAYDKRARELHGEFARLNFPDAGPQPSPQEKPDNDNAGNST